MMKNFMTTLPTKLFGIGLGNADYATASSLLTSSFICNMDIYVIRGASTYAFDRE